MSDVNWLNVRSEIDVLELEQASALEELEDKHVADRETRCRRMGGHFYKLHEPHSAAWHYSQQHGYASCESCGALCAHIRLTSLPHKDWTLVEEPPDEG